MWFLVYDFRFESKWLIWDLLNLFLNHINRVLDKHTAELREPRTSSMQVPLAVCKFPDSKLYQEWFGFRTYRSALRVKFIRYHSISLESNVGHCSVGIQVENGSKCHGQYCSTSEYGESSHKLPPELGEFVVHSTNFIAMNNCLTTN